MYNEALDITPRPTSVKAKKLRRQGYVPGVLYGYKQEAIPVLFDKKTIENFVSNMGDSVLFEIVLEGEKIPVNLKEVQRDPVSRDIFHIDLHFVHMDKKIHASIPFKFEGISDVEKRGQVLQYEKNKLEVEGYAKDIPSYVKVPVGLLSPGEKIYVHDLEISEELSIINDPNDVIAFVIDVKNQTDINDKIDEKIEDNKVEE